MSEFAPEQPVAPVEPPVVEAPAVAPVEPPVVEPAPVVAPAPVVEPVVEAPVETEHPEIVSVGSNAWTAQHGHLHMIVDKIEEWVTQDYHKRPPARVEFTTGLPVEDAPAEAPAADPAPDQPQA